MALRGIDMSKPLDVVSVGSWTNFDHLFRVDKLPVPGDTVQITSSIQNIETIYWGGCAPNNIAAAAKLGAKTGLISVVGEDFATRGYSKYLSELGVDLSGLIVVQGEHSGHSFLFADQHGDAICISHVGVADRQDDFEPDASVLASAKVVLINYRFDEFTYKAAKAAHDAGSYTIASGNLATSTNYVKEILQNTDMLICTAHELSILLEQIDHADDLSTLFAMGIQAIIETHGVDGSIIRTKESEIIVPAVLTDKVVDPVGAGDGFAGGFATGLAFGWSLEDAARLGAAVSSFIIEEVGCQTNQPTMEQVVGRLTERGIALVSSK